MGCQRSLRLTGQLWTKNKQRFKQNLYKLCASLNICKSATNLCAQVSVKLSRADWSWVELSRAKSSWVKQSRAELSCVKLSWAESCWVVEHIFDQLLSSVARRRENEGQSLKNDGVLPSFIKLDSNWNAIVVVLAMTVQRLLPCCLATLLSSWVYFHFQGLPFQTISKREVLNLVLYKTTKEY